MLNNSLNDLKMSEKIYFENSLAFIPHVCYYIIRTEEKLKRREGLKSERNKDIIIGHRGKKAGGRFFGL